MKKRDFLKSLLTIIPASILGEKVIAETVENKGVKEINIDKDIPNSGPRYSSGMCYYTHDPSQFYLIDANYSDVLKRVERNKKAIKNKKRK